MTETALDDNVDRLVQELAAAINARGGTLATSESLTGGQLAAAISAAPEAGRWYRGGIVAYHPTVKHSLLGTPPGPVVTAETAAKMAISTARLLGADFSAGVTGVGGPEPQEGKPAGTVYVATCAQGGDVLTELHHFQGRPVEVMEQTITAVLRALLSRIGG